MAPSPDNANPALSAGVTRTDQADGGPISAAPPHLLLVDDEPVILQILQAVFEDEPYRITAVATGREAERVIQGQGCAVLITDKNLPDLSGLDLLRLARAEDPLTEVILITGYASLDTAISAVELGAFDYVRKPLDNVFDIRAKVRRALEKRRMQVENRELVERVQRRNAELEHALAEARQLRSELIQSEKLAGIGTLAAGVAHEVSSPLFGILGLAEAITDESELEEAHSHAREIIEYCEGIRQIVQDLSRYSRAEGAEFQQRAEVREALGDALRLVRRSAPVDGVDFEVPTGEPVWVSAGQNELQQVFVNLLKNAAEAILANSDRGTVSVAVGVARGMAQVIFTDDGPGIPADKLDVVFDPFYTTKPVGQGTGLGLNVVYRIVTKYRGRIQARNHESGGATFEVALPLLQLADGTLDAGVGSPTG